MRYSDDTPVDPVIKKIFSRFFDGIPVSADMIDTGTGDSDFRRVFVVSAEEGEKYVLKLASNDFTFPEKIRMWKRTAEEYRSLGYYCPEIYSDRNGDFPSVVYQGRTCVVHAEEYSRYSPMEDRMQPDGKGAGLNLRAYAGDIWRMTAKIAAKKLDYTDYPSAYCLFETFSAGDLTDEVMENALEWKKAADTLPKEFSSQVLRIWSLWNSNRELLKEVYSGLSTSVFQADLNPSNLLVDREGAFKGILDFNLCGRDVFLNYLMRENHDDFEKEIGMIREALRISGEYYVFSGEEKKAALPLYRCLKPLWFNRVEDLKEAGDDTGKIRLCLDRIEYYLSADIRFADDMS